VDFLREKKIKLLYLVVCSCFAVYEFRSNFAFLFFMKKPPEVVVVCFFLLTVVLLKMFLKISHNHIAYFLVHSRASSVYLSLSVLNILAISGTSGSSGFGSHSKEQMESSTFDMVSAGDHCDLRISRQMLPLELMFG